MNFENIHFHLIDQIGRYFDRYSYRVFLLFDLIIDIGVYCKNGAIIGILNVIHEVNIFLT